MLNLKKDVFDGILNNDIAMVNKSQYISTLTNDITTIENDYYKPILIVIARAILFIFTIITYITLNISFTILVFIIGWIPIIVVNLLSKNLQGLKSEVSKNQDKFTQKIKDVFAGFEVIKSFNIEKETFEEYKKYNNKLEDSKYAYAKKMVTVDSASYLTGFGAFTVSTLMGVYLTITGKITVGEMLAAIQLLNYIVNPVVEVSECLSKIKFNKLIFNKLEKEIKKEAIEKTVSKTSFDKCIEFKNVNFFYDDKNQALKNINLVFEKNKKYAIIGESGSGKSTLLKLILGYYDQYDGSIKMDDAEINTIKKKDLYSNISIIHQNVFLFDGSIKENIDLYQGYSEEELENAIELSGLKKLIDRLVEGKDTLINENGSNFSGGEKQRISIARSLIKGTPIILLDEATAALDNRIAYDIENSIINLENKTIITITHRLSRELLSKYDEIIVLKEGQVVEKGQFDALYDNKGYFYELANIGA